MSIWEDIEHANVGAILTWSEGHYDRYRRMRPDGVIPLAGVRVRENDDGHRVVMCHNGEAFGTLDIDTHVFTVERVAPDPFEGGA